MANIVYSWLNLVKAASREFPELTWQNVMRMHRPNHGYYVLHSCNACYLRLPLPLRSAYRCLSRCHHVLSEAPEAGCYKAISSHTPLEVTFNVFLDDHHRYGSKPGDSERERDRKRKREMDRQTQTIRQTDRQIEKLNFKTMTVGTTWLIKPPTYLKYLNGRKPCELSMTSYYAHHS